jgi:CheY-like chemotaxis protein
LPFRLFIPGKIWIRNLKPAMKPKSIILYAEDDPDDRELLREAFYGNTDPIEIYDVINGKEVLLYLEGQMGDLPSLIILDLNMPILSGRETLAIIKNQRQTEKIPVVVLTTSGSPADKEFCNQYNVEMIMKPQSPMELKEIREKLLSYL